VDGEALIGGKSEGYVWHEDVSSCIVSARKRTEMMGVSLDGKTQFYSRVPCIQFACRQGASRS
jgi:hypothetical protein